MLAVRQTVQKCVDEDSYPIQKNIFVEDRGPTKYRRTMMREINNADVTLQSQLFYLIRRSIFGDKRQFDGTHRNAKVP